MEHPRTALGLTLELRPLATVSATPTLGCMPSLLMSVVANRPAERLSPPLTTSTPFDQGIFAESVNGCYGKSTSGVGIASDGAISNSWGESTSNSGIGGARIVTSSYAINNNANPNYQALYCRGVAMACTGENFAGGVAIEAPIAAGCWSLGGAINSPNKSLGTP